MEALRATGEFDDVNTGLDKGTEVRPDGNSFAHVDPHDAQQQSRWGSGGDDGVDVLAHCRITLSVSDNDPESRDAHLEKLLDVAQNIANDQSLAELTIPAFTRFHTWRWLPAKAPIRQIEAMLEYRYILDSSRDFDTEE